jgi:hypothetical protein
MQLTEVLGKGLKARSIGPAVMGGRVSDIAIDPRNSAVFYVGLATGGLFKTGNNGVSFDAVFDKQSALSIGAVAVAPSDSDVIWVGTGEGNDRNSRVGRRGLSFHDGGKWTNVGLKDSRAIAPRRSSDETGSPCRRAWQPLERWWRPRLVQDNLRRQDLETRPARAFP